MTDGARTDTTLEWLLAGDPAIRWQSDRDVIDAPREAVEILIDRRRPDGRWPKGSEYTGPTFLTMEPGRVAWRRNTVRARRVLRSSDGQKP